MATDVGVWDVVRWFGSMKVGIFGISFSWLLPGVCLPSVCLFVMAGVLSGQSFPTKFHTSIADDARVTSALHSIEQRREELIQEWIRLAEILAEPGGEQARAQYVRERLPALGFTDVRTDEIGNVIAELHGTDPHGPVIAFAAHMDTVFAASVPRKVRRDNGKLYCPGIGDDTSGLVSLIAALEAVHQAGIKLHGTLVLVASVQEERRLQGVRYLRAKSEIHPDMFVAIDTPLGEVWYGALRVNRLKFYYTSPGSHTLTSRGKPSPARALALAIEQLYEIPLPPVEPGFGVWKVPVINVGMLGGGTAPNAIPQEAWFTVDLRSQDASTQERLELEVLRGAQAAAEKEGVGFRMQKPSGEDVDYSKVRSREVRRADPIVQTALDIQRYLNIPSLQPAPLDIGSTDANVAIGMGIPGIAIGGPYYERQHTLDEVAEESSTIPGTKMLILFAVSLAELAD
jgi:tripeptide aminopeptidase